MITAGLDVGSLWTKAAVVRDGELIGWHIGETGGDTARAARDTLDAALTHAGLGRADLRAIVATGAGKKEVGCAHGEAGEEVCAARGAAIFFSGIQGVIDMGGESTRVVKLDAEGHVLDLARNDKCASGTGIFLDAMAKVMGVTVEEMGPLSLESTADVSITSTCVAFAESEVVSQIHRQTPKEDILKGMHKSIASRIFGMVQRIDIGKGSNMAIGGLARNVGVVRCLEEMMADELQIPEQPQIVSATGAALIAVGKDRS